MQTMKITGFKEGTGSSCLDISRSGSKKDDGIVTLTEDAVVTYCLGEGREGLCTRRFRADLVADSLDPLSPDQIVRCGTAEFLVTGRRKHCHPGCALDPADCLLMGRVYFLKVITPGRVCLGDVIE